MTTRRLAVWILRPRMQEYIDRVLYVITVESLQRYVCWPTLVVSPPSEPSPTAVSSRCPLTSSTRYSNTTRSWDGRWSQLPRRGSTRSVRTRPWSALERTSKTTSTRSTNSSCTVSSSRPTCIYFRFALVTDPPRRLGGLHGGSSRAERRPPIILELLWTWKRMFMALATCMYRVNCNVMLHKSCVIMPCDMQCNASRTDGR